MLATQIIPFEGKKFKIEIISDYTSQHEDWFRLICKNKTIQIIMKMDHPFTEGYLGSVSAEQEGIYLLLMYMGLAEIFIGEKYGTKQQLSTIRTTLNDILRVQPPKYA